ncbi:MAG: thiamine diphosphokinase [Anaerolineae bacterium]|nr:thiamine diphosphokinase [Anaerolineae bacterium]
MRIVVFANGVMDDPAAEADRWAAPDSLLISADGGAVHARAAGLTLDHVIGDLDSISAALQAELQGGGTEFHRSPVAKDETDLELALIWAAAQPNVDEIVILGVFGGRPDQALANLLLLALPDLAGHPVWMVDGAWTVRVIRGGERLTVRGTAGDRLSLIPLGGPAEDVTTEGLQFPLAEETLAFGPARGVSNRLVSDTAAIELGSGMLWCFHGQVFDAP